MRRSDNAKLTMNMLVWNDEMNTFFSMPLHYILYIFYRCPEALHFQKDVNDATVSNEGHDPEEEEQYSKEVWDQRVDWSKLTPMGTHDLHHLLECT